MKELLRPDAELSVRHPGPYLTFSIIFIPIILVSILGIVPQGVIKFIGNPIWAYIFLAFSLHGLYYYVFGAWWHRHIISGDHWIVQQGMRHYILPIRKIVPIEAITKLRREVGVFGVQFDGLFVYYKSGDAEEKFPIVLIAHPYPDLLHFLTILKQKRPDLDIPLIDRGKRRRNKGNRAGGDQIGQTNSAVQHGEFALIQKYPVNPFQGTIAERSMRPRTARLNHWRGYEESSI